MEERQVSVDGQPHPLPSPFMVAATQNPVEYEGTYPLPEAQLDRFLLKVVLPLPQRDDEVQVLRRHASGFDPRDLAAAGIRPAATVADLDAGVAAVREVAISDEVATYIVDIARATRVSPVPRAGRLAARRHRADGDQPGLGLARRAHLRDPRRRQGPRARHPRPPALAAPGGRARGRRRGCGARERARVGARPPLMAITWRTVVLALLGLAPVAVWPHASTVRWWVLLVVVLVALDVLLASRPRVLTIVRGEPTQVRLGETTSSSLWVTNTSGRGVRGLLRDAWPPVGRGGGCRAHPRGAPARAGAPHHPPRAHPAR